MNDLQPPCLLCKGAGRQLTPVRHRRRQTLWSRVLRRLGVR